jgi:hypothetical protein
VCLCVCVCVCTTYVIFSHISRSNYFFPSLEKNNFLSISYIIIIIIIIIMAIQPFVGPCPLFQFRNLFYTVATGLVMWNLWWTKWRWGRFSPSSSVSLANLHSTNFSTITITYHMGLVQ